VARVESRLPALLPAAHDEPRRVHEAMRYAALAPGKRIRPALTLATAEIFDAASPAILDLACAVELVHACSLVLDDLPSMDDAKLRRGRRTAHLEFGEDVAILAAFALLNRGYELVAEAAHGLAITRYTTADLLHHLTRSVSTAGLIGGQALDLRLGAEDPASATLADLESIHSRKTGALFVAAAELGAMAADARRKDLEAIASFAKNLGLAFQIEDDLVDATLTSAESGKDEHQDASRANFVALLGLDGAAALADELLDFATASLAPFGRRAEPLRSLAELVRDYGRPARLKRHAAPRGH
jgi:geranylgeranyl pyrophosphate synthase